MAERACRICDGMGMRIVERADGYPLAEPCECRVKRRNAELLRRSRIPERYKGCVLENYNCSFVGADPSLSEAFIKSKGFVDNYFMHKSDGVGLLFTGSMGTGKTHLAVGMLQALVLKQGVRALFCDQGELLKAVGNSYNKNVSTTELEVLRPVLEAELLVIDELGRFNKSEWVSDIVAHVLNTRYNDKLKTIITTNYPNRATGQAAVEHEPEVREELRGATPHHAGQSSAIAQVTYDDFLDRMDVLEGRKVASALPEPPGDTRLLPARSFATQKLPVASKVNLDQARKPSRVKTEETLGDRIGERMRSRLAEMCVTIEMSGKDYRQGAKKATFL